MDKVLDFMINNDYFSIGLLCLLVVLVILFFVVLFLGKNKNVKNEIIVPEDNNTDNVVDNNIDFDHGEYVKETTAEFELAPINEVAPAPDNYIPEVQEESPAIKFESREEPVLKDFSFDELSKSISDELDKLKNEDEQVDVVNSVVNEQPSEFKSFDAFKETSDIKPVEINRISDIENAGPVFITDRPNFEKEDTMVLPKLAQEGIKEELKKEEVNEPILKDEEVPLFQRFNQETFEINKKD